MSNNKKQIIAIGGGGFFKYGEYSPENLLIERYFLAQTGKDLLSICFIPTASAESPKYIVDFYSAFSTLECRPLHLSLFKLPIADLESFIMKQDAIYVGGGNTKSMLAVWREWNLDVILKKAWESGIVLGGISAGSICWFDEGVTDSIPGSLTCLPALGFLKGSNCPHYDGEKERRPAYHDLMRTGKIGSGIAIDDYAAVHFVDNHIEKIVRAKPTAHAYRVYKTGNDIIEEQL